MQIQFRLSTDEALQILEEQIVSKYLTEFELTAEAKVSVAIDESNQTPDNSIVTFVVDVQTKEDDDGEQSDQENGPGDGLEDGRVLQLRKPEGVNSPHGD